MAQSQECRLTCTKGTSNKEYNLRLEPVGDLWNVMALYGAIGGNLKTELKTASGPVAYDEAMAIYQEIKKEKLHPRKGYVEDVSGSAAPVVISQTKASEPAVESELLTPIEACDLERFIKDDRYVFQEKADGDRRPIRGYNGERFVGYNRTGLVVNGLPREVVEEFKALTFGNFILDGEIEGPQYWAFSALQCGGQSLLELPWIKRYEAAKVLFGQHSFKHIKLMPIWEGTQAKTDAVCILHESNAEGIVIVDKTATWKPGRAGQHFKLKFVTTASVRVKYHNEKGKRSVGIEMSDGADWQHMGNCSVPEKYGDLPLVGSVIEVGYLYASHGGHLVQPTFKRKRTDITEEACTTAQLKYKRGKEPTAA